MGHCGTHADPSCGRRADVHAQREPAGVGADQGRPEDTEVGQIAAAVVAALDDVGAPRAVANEPADDLRVVAVRVLGRVVLRVLAVGCRLGLGVAVVGFVCGRGNHVVDVEVVLEHVDRRVPRQRDAVGQEQRLERREADRVGDPPVGAFDVPDALVRSRRLRVKRDVVAWVRRRVEGVGVLDDVLFGDGEVGQCIGGRCRVATGERELLDARLAGGDRNGTGEEDHAAVYQGFDRCGDVVDRHRTDDADADRRVAGDSDAEGTGQGERLRLCRGAGVDGQAGGIGDRRIDDLRPHGLDDCVDGHGRPECDRNARALGDSDRDADAAGVGRDHGLIAGLDTDRAAGIQGRVEDLGDRLGGLAVDIADLVAAAGAGAGESKRTPLPARRYRSGDTERERVDCRRRGRFDDDVAAGVDVGVDDRCCHGVGDLVGGRGCGEGARGTAAFGAEAEGDRAAAGVSVDRRRADDLEIVAVTLDDPRAIARVSHQPAGGEAEHVLVRVGVGAGEDDDLRVAREADTVEQECCLYGGEGGGIVGKIICVLVGTTGRGVITLFDGEVVELVVEGGGGEVEPIVRRFGGGDVEVARDPGRVEIGHLGVEDIGDLVAGSRSGASEAVGVVRTFATDSDTASNRERDGIDEVGGGGGDIDITGRECEACAVEQ